MEAENADQFNFVAGRGLKGNKYGHGFYSCRLYQKSFIKFTSLFIIQDGAKYVSTTCLTNLTSTTRVTDLLQ